MRQVANSIEIAPKTISALTTSDQLKTRSEQQFNNAIRLGCTSGAPTVVATKLTDIRDQTLDQLNATAIYLSAPETNTPELIRSADRVMFHLFDPKDPTSYFQNCSTYVSQHSDSQASNQESFVGGPGMITVLSDLSDFDTYFETLSHFKNILNLRDFLDKTNQPVPADISPINIGEETLKSILPPRLQTIFQERNIGNLLLRDNEEFNRFLQLINAFNKSPDNIQKLLDSPEEENSIDTSSLRQMLNQPTVVEINDLSQGSSYLDQLIQSLQTAYQNGALDGFILHKSEDLKVFKTLWEKNNPHLREPHLIFQNNAEEILKFFEEQNDCDGYIVSGEISPNSAQKIWDTRINQIAAHSQTEELNDNHAERGKIRIGVVALQGAYKQEKQLIESIQDEFGEKLPYQIEVLLVRTRAEIERMNLDGLVLGGGWHGPQLELYNDERLGIIDAVQKGIQNGRDFFFSCAGAILARKKHKKSSGCSEHPPADIMDYAIDNNYVNGTKPAEIKTNGKFKDLTGHFVGAPAFSKIGRDVSVIGRLTDDDTIIAVEQIEESGSILIATAAHNRSLLLRWLNMIMKKRLDQVEIQSIEKEG